MDRTPHPAPEHSIPDAAASVSASNAHPHPLPPPEPPPQEHLPSTENDQNPLNFEPNPRAPLDAFLLTRPWVLALLPPILVYFPLTALPLASAVGVYFYLLHEEHFNASLARATPPAPDQGLPKGRSQWLEGGGLLQVGKREDEGGEVGECVVCRGEWEDPVKVKECGHVFCGTCLGAWFKGGHRTCPQCTRPLWREDRSSIGHLRELERLAKATAAICMLAFPLTLVADATYFLYFFHHLCPTQRTISRWIMLFALLGTSALVLTLMFQGFQFMLARRRTHGLGWWGRELADPQESEAWRMALCTLSLVAGVWLVQVCVVGEEFGRGLAPGLLEWRVWVRMGWGGAWGL